MKTFDSKPKTTKGMNYFRNPVALQKKAEGNEKIVPVQQHDTGSQKGKALRDYENEWDDSLVQEIRYRNQNKIKSDEIKNGLADRALLGFGAVVPEDNDDLNLVADEILGDNHLFNEDSNDSHLYEEELHTMLGDTDYEKALREQLKSTLYEISLLPPEQPNEPKAVMNKRYTLEEHRDETLSKLRELNGDGVTSNQFNIPSESDYEKRKARVAQLDPDHDDNDYGYDLHPGLSRRSKIQ